MSKAKRPIRTNQILNPLKKNRSNIYKQVVKYISRPKRKKIAVNLLKINKIGKNGETVVVPGKVLGNGIIDKNITVFAENFSSNAKEKIEKYGKALKLTEWDGKTGRLVC